MRIIKEEKTKISWQRFTYSVGHYLLILLYWGENGNTINPRGQRHIVNVWHLSDPPSFSLPTTFKRLKIALWPDGTFNSSIIATPIFERIPPCRVLRNSPAKQSRARANIMQKFCIIVIFVVCQE
jgi:hypothetical protein